MKNVLKWVGIVLGVLILALVAVNLMSSGKVYAERSIVIDRPAAEIHAVANDFGQFANWSPWQRLDPGMKTTISNPAVGPGATYEWDSKKDSAGAGRMVITASQPGQYVAQSISFNRPQESTAVDTMFFAPEGNGTRVRWVMHSEMPFPVKWMAADVGKYVEQDYELGLANLKRYVESKPAAPADSSVTTADTTAAGAPVH